MDIVRKHVVKLLDIHCGSKVILSLVCDMVKVDVKSGVETVSTLCFYSARAMVILPSIDLQDLYNQSELRILENFSTYLKLGSGWQLLKVLKI